MAYEPQTFTAGEVLTATKMNKIAGNQTSFHDGTGIDNNTITSSKIDFTTIYKTLWEESGSGAHTTSFTLSESISNFHHLNIYWRRSDLASNHRVMSQVEVSSDGSVHSYILGQASIMMNTGVQLFTASFTGSGTTLTLEQGEFVNVYYAGGAESGVCTEMEVYKIEGVV